MRFWIFTLLFIFAACSKNELGPESALADFINLRAGKVIDREFVLKRVSGKMLENLKNMSAENFARFANMQNIKSNSFKVLEKSCQDKKCVLTYSINYSTENENKTLFASEVKKTAEMVQIDNKWLIEEVRTIETLHESLEPINPFQ